MKKLLLVISFLLVANLCYATPTTTIAVPNTFTANTIIYSSQVNANYVEIQNKYNTHSHTDITTLSSLVSIGTITTGVWNGTTVAIAYGGTGLTSAGTTANRALVTTDGTAWSAGQVNLTNMVSGTMPVGNGGTGLGVVASGDLLYGSTAANNTLSVLAIGTSGYFLKSQGAGANPIWAATGTANIVVYTSGSGNWTAPTGVTAVFVSMVGGGGGGDGQLSGGGGGGESLINYYVPVIAGNSYAYSVGTGGAVGNNGVILKTINGGINWTQLTSGINNNLYSICLLFQRT